MAILYACKLAVEKKIYIQIAINTVKKTDLQLQSQSMNQILNFDFRLFQCVSKNKKK